MDNKSGFPLSNINQQGYPGPPEYVEQFPRQNPYPTPATAQYHGMPTPMNGEQFPPPMAVGGYPAFPQVMPQGYPPQGPIGYPPPVMHQPMANQFGITDGFYVDTELPYRNRGGDPSLALNYLKTVSRLEIRQKIELLEIFTNFETPNKYSILNEHRQPVLYAMEMSDCCARQCCGSLRPMEITIVDMYQTEVIHLNRPLRCHSFCYPCCLQVLEVSSPPGNIVSTIEQCWSLWPKFDVKDASGNAVIRIEGPFCTCSCCCKDVRFEILSAEDDSSIGQISKKWSGFTNEYFTKADNFEVEFPQDLDVYFKAALLGAVFLIDMMYFEEQQSKANNY